jgi:hypothetical protein
MESCFQTFIKARHCEQSEAIFIDQAGSGEFSISLVRILFSFILSTYLSALPEANQKPGTRNQKPDTRNQKNIQQ